MKSALLCIVLVGSLYGETLTVVQEKTLWRDAHGLVHIGEQGIVYESAKEDESRAWSYNDIQYFDRISRKEFVILTYEDRKRYLGRDRQYHFTITEGELTADLFRRVSGWLGRPVTNREVSEVTAAYSLPVKHQHGFGGCEGELQFTPEAIYYVSKQKEDTREWLVARDVQSVWSMNRYQFEVHAYDNNRREFSRTRVYKFDLKAPLDPSVYRALKWKLYQLETTHLLMR
ncbi:MAG: hypothetical protein R2762_09710 [Bryobacteraceae bacterium]